jgi:uncharacterized protein (TIGR00290 family)
MADETGARTRSHALPVEFVRRQAASLGLPLMVRSATWEQYEDQFIAAVRELAADGVRAGVFGDIDIEDHRAWEERVCAAAGLTAFLPLWGMPRRRLLDEVFAAGIRATIVTTEARVLDETFIGRELTPALVDEIEAAGSDAAGELGEYHTAVTDAPLFVAPVQLQVRGTIRAPGHWHAELSVALATDADRPPEHAEG